MDPEIKDILRRAQLFETESLDLSQYYEKALKYALSNFKQSDSESNLWREFVNDTGQQDRFDPFEPELSDPKVKRQYAKFVKEYFRENIENFEWTIRRKLLPGKSSILVYREIQAPKDWIQKGGLTNRALGIYWSWDESAAEAHWAGTGGVNYLIKAEVALKDINWVATLAKNVDVSLGEEEKEIEINPYARVKLHGVYERNYRHTGAEIPIGYLKGRMMKV